MAAVRVVDEMSRIHERHTLGCCGIGHSQDGIVADERFVDQDMFARRYRCECSFFFGGRRDSDVDGVDVRTGQQVIDALDRRNPLTFGHEALCGVNRAARHGDQFGIRRFVYRIGNDAGDHSSSNNAEPKLRVLHRFSFFKLFSVNLGSPVLVASFVLVVL
jgi:hypothetical protein